MLRSIEGMRRLKKKSFLLFFSSCVWMGIIVIEKMCMLIEPCAMPWVEQVCLPVRLLEGVTCQERGWKKTFFSSFQSSSSGTLNERAEREKKLKKISLCKFLGNFFFNLSCFGFLMFICNDLFSILGRAEGTVFSTKQKYIPYKWKLVLLSNKVHSISIIHK